MSNDPNKSDSWEPCPQGELSRLARRLDQTSRRRQFRQLTSTAAVSALVTAAAVMYWGVVINGGEPRFGGIHCAECQAHAEAYRDWLVDQIPMEDPQLADNMAAHLAECPRCGPHFESMYPGVLTSGIELPRPLQTHLIPMLAMVRPASP